MTKLEVLSAFFLGTLVYVMLAVTGGRDGVWAQKQLEAHMRGMSVRAAEIAALNEELELECAGLRSSPDVAAARARNLGYVAEGERLIKINGLGKGADEVREAGAVLFRGETRSFPEWVCKSAGLSVAALFLLACLLYRMRTAARSLGAARGP